MNIVGNEAWALGITADAIAGTLAANKVALYQSNTIPSPARPLSDYTEATYDGYAKKSVTWSAPTRSDDGFIEVVGVIAEFRPTGSVTPNSIYGVLLVDTTGAILYGAARFDDPVPLPMNSTLDQILITLRIRITPGGLVVTIT